MLVRYHCGASGDPEASANPTTDSPEAITTASIVICTCDRTETIARAVESVARQPYAAFEVVVVDQSHSGETQRIVAEMGERYPQVRYVRLDQVGLSRAYNAGVCATTGEIIAFTDDDCVAPASWLPTILQRFAQNPEVMLLYGTVAPPEELAALNGVSGVVPTLELARRRLSRRDGYRVAGMGANFAVRRAHHERIGGFDKFLGGGAPLRSAQDYDYAYRTYRAGGTILLEPDVVVYHYGFRPWGEWSATMRAYGIGDGAFYFKHVRCGDLYVARLLLGRLCLCVARECKRTLMRGLRGPRGSQRADWMYTRSLLVGVARSLRFGVDRGPRMYRRR